MQKVTSKQQSGIDLFNKNPSHDVNSRSKSIGGNYREWLKIRFIRNLVVKKHHSFVLDAISQHRKAFSIERVKVLDVGCGTGSVASVLARAGFDVLAVDIHEPTIKDALHRHSLPNLEFKVIDPMDIREGDWDVVVLTQVLEHVPDARAFLSHLSSLLNSSGIMVITIPNGSGPYEIFDKFYRQYIRYTRLHKVFRLLRCIVIKDQDWDQYSQKLSLSEEELPHVQHFCWNDFLNLLSKCGLQVKYSRNSAWISGIVFFRPLFSIFPNWKFFDLWLADILPPWIVSGWMFVCTRT